MLGKQWLSRYLCHAGGSIIECCGDRKRKFNDLGRWLFRLSIKGLPVILQVAPFLLTCAWSRNMWSVNTSVARAVNSFTAFNVLFYIRIVIAGMNIPSKPRRRWFSRIASRSFSPSNMISLGYQIINLLLWIPPTFWKATQSLVRRFVKLFVFKRTSRCCQPSL